MAYTAVFGAVFVDIKGFSFNKYQPFGRNLGEVKIVHGGVSRNVAENLANIGKKVCFVSMLTDDGIGGEVRRRLDERGVDLRYAVNAEGGMGMWLAVMDEKGELAGSISRQPIFTALERLIDERGDEIVRNCNGVVLEVDMCASIAEKVLSLAEKYEKDVYVVVGNLSVILQRPQFLSRAKLFIMNEIEAARLFGCPVERHCPEKVLEISREAVERLGIREIVVTLGDQGAVFLDAASGAGGYIPAEQAVMVDSTGAGDAFFSGTVAARIEGIPLEKAARLGAHLAALTIQTEESTCPKLEHFLPDTP